MENLYKKENQNANVSLKGDFSIQVLQRALETLHLVSVQFGSNDAREAQRNPARESAFICNLRQH